MSRSSRISRALTDLQEEGLIEAFARMPGEGQIHWLVRFDGHEQFFTSSEAEAFILGASL